MREPEKILPKQATHEPTTTEVWETMSDLRVAAGVGSITAESIVGAIKRGEIRHLSFVK